MSMDRLIKLIIEKQNPTVAGLDPKLDFIPSYIKEKAFAQHGKNLEGAAAAILEYNIGLIDALCDIVPAVKPQLAYYEMYGYKGVETFYKTVEYAKSKGMYVIADGKRNDIGTTMEAYAIAHLGITDVESEKVMAFGSNSLTVNPYLGTDTIAPLLDLCKEQDGTIFVLVKTSNKSSGELQDLKLENGTTIYSHMGQMCQKWGADTVGEYGYSCVGAVVGATYPEQLTTLRKEMANTFFLVPGYGAQGGTADDIKGAFDEKGLGAIVNSSRGIMCAWQKGNYSEQDYAKAAYDEAVTMKNLLTDVTGKIG